MTIKEYIIKNLPNFNWNILPQIFEENGVEMSEEIEAYLRNTPENTNWSILEQLGGSGEKLPKVIFVNPDTLEVDTSKSSFSTPLEAYNWCISNCEENINKIISTDKIIIIGHSNLNFTNGENNGDGFWVWTDTNNDGNFTLGEDSWMIVEY